MPSPLEHPRVMAFDDAADRAFDRLRGRQNADRFFYALTEAANHSLLWHGIGITRGLITGRKKEAVRLAVILGIESALVNGPVKTLFGRSRPLHEAERPHRLRTPRTTSFPSGHATSAFCAAVILSERSRAKPAWFGLAMLTASSRIHVRIHHASDVIAGALFGLGFGTLMKWVWRIPERN